MEVDDEANCSTDPDGSVHKASVTKKSLVKIVTKMYIKTTFSQERQFTKIQKVFSHPKCEFYQILSNVWCKI